MKQPEQSTPFIVIERCKHCSRPNIPEIKFASTHVCQRCKTERERERHILQEIKDRQQQPAEDAINLLVRSKW